MAYRILQIGEFETPQYDEAIAHGFEELGHEVYRFKHFDYIRPVKIFDRIQNRLLSGPNYWRLWNDILSVAEEFKPHIVYYRRPNELPPHILTRLRSISHSILVSYQNDDPFGPDIDKHWFKNFHKNISYFDIHFTFRELNIEDYRRSGAKNVQVLLPYYVSEMHHPSVLTEEEMVHLRSDALFIGHGESDNRLEAFDKLIEADLSLTLGGSGFEKYAKGRPHEKLLPTKYFGKEIYSKALQSANCALCFFSKRNRDVMTTRVFEIPACKGVLVAERNETVKRFFEDKKEAFFFSSTSELIEIVKLLKRDKNLRNDIALRGHNRLLAQNHEAVDRARQIITAIETL